MAEFGNLDQVLGLLQQSFEQSQQTIGQLDSAYGAQIGGHYAAGQAKQDQLAAQQIIDLQKDTGELRAQQNKRAAATALGTNMDDKSEIVSVLGNAMRSSALSSLQNAARVADIEANNDLFLNPFGFLRDFAVGDQARAQLKASTDLLATASDSLAKLNQATQSTAITQEAIAETKSAATVAARQDQLAAQMREAAANTQVAAGGAAASRIKAINQMNNQQLGNVIQAYQFRLDAEERIYGRAQAEERAAASKENREYQRWVRETSLAEKEAAAQDEASAIATIRRGAEVAGIPLTEADAKQLIKLDKGTATIYQRLGLQSKRAESNGIPYSPGAMGGTPSESYAAWNQLGYRFSPAAEDTVRLSMEVEDMVSDPVRLSEFYQTTSKMSKRDADVAAQKVLTGTKAERDAARQSIAAWQLSRYRDRPTSEPTRNPYALIAANHLDDAAFSNPFIEHYVLPSVQAAREKDDYYFIDPQYLAGAAQLAIQEGEFTQDTIVDGITGLIRRMMLLNNEVREFRRLGMPEQTSYNATIGKRATAMTIDIANPVRWNEFLARSAAVKARDDKLRGNAILPGGELYLRRP